MKVSRMMILVLSTSNSTDGKQCHDDGEHKSSPCHSFDVYYRVGVVIAVESLSILWEMAKDSKTMT